ncbi:MAG: hypothetical protein JKY25_09800 [Robiginitomaculum sp.]|nr:hypothetical protein [Robiginitomaculum sp.]
MRELSDKEIDTIAGADDLFSELYDAAYDAGYGAVTWFRSLLDSDAWGSPPADPQVGGPNGCSLQCNT